MRPQSSHDAGIWRIPDGDRIYAAALQSSTTTNLSADEIHALGVSEVERIEQEMLTILDAQGIQGATLAERIEKLERRSGAEFPEHRRGPRRR